MPRGRPKSLKGPETLEELMQRLQKRYGVKRLSVASEVEELYKVQHLPTGIPQLDEILGGGLPRGHITEFFGPWSGGKSWLALLTIAETQKAGGIAALIDTEVSFAPGLAHSLGVDFDRLILNTPETGEQALDLALELVKQELDLIVLDSATSLATKETIASDVEISGYPSAVRLWNAGLTRIKPALAFRKTAFVFCVAPGTHILTEDLRWVKAEKLTAGSRIIGVDEHPGKRRVRSGTITQHSLAEASRVQIVTDRGTIVVTDNHPFLTIRPNETHTAWVQAKDLKLGQHIKFIAGRWSEEDGDSWLAGLADDEGSVSASRARSVNVRITQNPGLVLNRIMDELDKRGLDVKLYKRTFQAHSATLLGTEDTMRFLGQVRPARLLQRWADLVADGVAMPHYSVARVAYVKPLGIGPIVSFATSIRTYVAEGLISHNTNQVRDNIGVMYGPQTTEPLGWKSKHEAALRLEVRRKEWLKSGDQKVGQVTLIRIQKTKVDGVIPFSETTIDIPYVLPGKQDGN